MMKISSEKFTTKFEDIKFNGNDDLIRNGLARTR